MSNKIDYDQNLQGFGTCRSCGERLSECPDFGYCNEDWEEDEEE